MNSHNYQIIKDDRDKNGTIFIVVYFDSNGKVCSKDEAVRAIKEESNKDGNLLMTSYCKIKK